MFGYACGRYLMAKMTPSSDVMMMMMGAMPRAADSAIEGKAKMDGFQLANG
jgi:hypothetical protein